MTIHKSVAALELDLRSIARQFETQVGQVVRKVALDIHASCAQRTPVDSGRAAASWGLSQNRDSVTVQPEGTYGSPLASSQGLITMPARALSEYWIWNNTPYIQMLEYGMYPGTGPKTVNGYSTQAPTGILAVAFSEAKVKINQELEDVLRRRA